MHKISYLKITPKHNGTLIYYFKLPFQMHEWMPPKFYPAYILHYTIYGVLVKVLIVVFFSLASRKKIWICGQNVAERCTFSIMHVYTCIHVYCIIFSGCRKQYYQDLCKKLIPSITSLLGLAVQSCRLVVSCFIFIVLYCVCAHTCACVYVCVLRVLCVYVCVCVCI